MSQLGLMVDSEVGAKPPRKIQRVAHASGQYTVPLLNDQKKPFTATQWAKRKMLPPNGNRHNRVYVDYTHDLAKSEDSRLIRVYNTQVWAFLTSDLPTLLLQGRTSQFPLSCGEDDWSFLDYSLLPEVEGLEHIIPVSVFGCGPIAFIGGGVMTDPVYGDSLPFLNYYPHRCIKVGRDYIPLAQLPHIIAVAVGQIEVVE